MSAATSSDRRFLFSVIFVLAALSSLPYLYGWLRQTAALEYLGLHAFASGDTYVYFSYLWQVRDGHLVFADLYTTEASQVSMLNTFWAAAGTLGNVLRLPIPLAFHASRLLAIPVAVVVLWVLLSRYFSEVWQRRWGLLLAVFASGISGYLLPVLTPGTYAGGYYHWPPDLWVAESNVFLSALHSGHMLASLALVVVVLLCSMAADQQGNGWRSILAGLAALLVFSFHPFQAPLVLGILAAWTVMRSAATRRVCWGLVRHLAIVVAFAAPVMVYYLRALADDPVTAGRAAQNAAWTPAWPLLLLGYGFLIPGAAIGLWRLSRERQLASQRWQFLLTWLAVQAALVLLPFVTYQRRLLGGLQLPLVILTVYGWPLVAARLPGRARRWLAGRYAVPLAAACLLLLFGFTNLVNVANELGLMYERNGLMFWPRAELAGLRSLRALTDERSVILAGPNPSYLIPGLTGRRVVAGHGIETIDLDTKLAAVARFYGRADNDWRRAFLERYGVTHVVAGSREVGRDWSALEAAAFLKEIWRNEAVRIYQVEWP